MPRITARGDVALLGMPTWLQPRNESGRVVFKMINPLMENQNAGSGVFAYMLVLFNYLWFRYALTSRLGTVTMAVSFMVSFLSYSLCLWSLGAIVSPKEIEKRYGGLACNSAQSVDAALEIPTTVAAFEWLIDRLAQ